MTIARFPITILWLILYFFSLYLAFESSISAEMGYMLFVLGIGVPMTLLTYMELSVILPGRMSALYSGSILLILWLGTVFLVRSAILWELFFPVNTIALIGIGLVIGSWLAVEIEKSGHLIPVCVLAALVDIWSVFLGPTQQIGEKATEHMVRQQGTSEFIAPPVTNFLLVHWPNPGAAMMSPIFGFGDLVFIALFFASSRRFGLSIGKTFILLFLGLIAAIGLAFRLERPIPALPFICGLFLFGNLKGLSLDAKELRITIGLAIFIILVGFFSYFNNLIIRG